MTWLGGAAKGDPFSSSQCIEGAIYRLAVNSRFVFCECQLAQSVEIPPLVFSITSVLAGGVPKSRRVPIIGFLGNSALHRSPTPTREFSSHKQSSRV